MNPDNKWTMPSWMIPYMEHISDTGGNSIAELMNDHKTTVFENAPRALICTAVQAQVRLLMRLHNAGLLPS